MKRNTNNDDRDDSTPQRHRVASLGAALLVVLSSILASGAFVAPVAATHNCDGVDMTVAAISAGVVTMHETATGEGDVTEAPNWEKCAYNHGGEVVDQMKENDADQEAVDYYQGLASAQESSEAFRYSQENNLQDTESKALMVGQEAYLKEYNETGSVSSARAAGIEAIEDYYSTKQINTLESSETQVADIEYIRESAQNESDITADDVLTAYDHRYNLDDPDYKALENATASNQTWNIKIYDEADYTAPSSLDTATPIDDGWSVDTHKVDVELANGSTHTTTLLYDGHNGAEQGFLPVPEKYVRNDAHIDDYAYHGPSMEFTDGKWTLKPGNHVVYAEAPNSNYNDTVAYNPDQYARLYVQSDLSSERVVDNLKTWSDSVGPKLENGEIKPSEAVPALTWAEQYADKYEESNHLIYATAMLADAGKVTPNLENTGVMEVSYQGSTYTGYVILSDNNVGGLDVGETYHTSEFEGQEYLLTESGKQVTMSGEFTIEEAYNKGGGTTDSVGYKSYTHKTANATEFQELTNDLTELREEIESREPTAGGAGGGGPDVGPMQAAGVIGILVAVLYVLYYRSDDDEPPYGGR